MVPLIVSSHMRSNQTACAGQRRRTGVFLPGEPGQPLEVLLPQPDTEPAPRVLVTHRACLLSRARAPREATLPGPAPRG
jgi:hypothetical protein